MLRAWRINRYGTTNSKLIARRGGRPAARPRPQAGRKVNGARGGSKATKTTGTATADRKPPTANKRYTPKSPPRKKIPKPLRIRAGRPRATPIRVVRARAGVVYSAGSTRSAERNNCSTSARRRTKRPGRRLLPQGPQHLDLGHHPDHGGVDREQQQPGIVPTHGPRIHLRLQEMPTPAARAARGPASSVWRPGGRDAPPRGTSPSNSGWRAARRNTERTTASTRSQPSPAPCSAVSSAVERSAGAPGDDGLEQGVLGGEPVEDRLLGDLEPFGHGVERRGLVAPAGEGGQGRVEDAVLGRGGGRARGRRISDWAGEAENWALTKW